MSTEEILIKKIENNLRGIKLGTKTPSQVKEDTETRLVRLRKSNPHMADDLEYQWLKAKSAQNENAY